MVDFVRKRLQVFVSSTFVDLSHERQAAVEAILTAGHIPAGMELFTSGDESQMEVIKQWIDESDVYLLILGGRYGSVEAKSGKSYTQLEYEYALDTKKPLFSCVVTESALERRVKEHGSSVLETANPAGLRQFRAEVLSRMVKYWDDHKDIKIAVGETLSHFARRDDLMGWVRPAAKEVDMEGLLNEISRLSMENAQLRDRPVTNAAEPLISGFTFQETQELLSRMGLLDFLRLNRDLFLQDYGMKRDKEGKCEKLAFLGLVYLNIGFGSYSLTGEGRLFLSRLDLALMRKAATPPKGAA